MKSSTFSIRVAATAAGFVLAGSAMAGQWAGASALNINAFMPAAERPYAAAEIYAAADLSTRSPQIRVTRTEIAYRGKDFTATDVCNAYYKALRQKSGGAVMRDFGCISGAQAGWAVQPSTDDTVRATTVVNYRQAPKPITETLSMVFVVCKPLELYDPVQHICYNSETVGGN